MKRYTLLILISGFFTADVVEAGLLRDIFRSRRQKKNCCCQSTNDQKASPKNEQKASPETKSAKKLMDLTISEYWQMIDRENAKAPKAAAPAESSPPAPPETVKKASPVLKKDLQKPSVASKILTIPNTTEAKGKPFVTPSVTKPIVKSPPPVSKPFTIIP